MGGRGDAERELGTLKQYEHAAEQGTEYQVPYEPASKVGNVGTLVPKNMQSAVSDALAIHNLWCRGKYRQHPGSARSRATSSAPARPCARRSARRTDDRSGEGGAARAVICH